MSHMTLVNIILHFAHPYNHGDLLTRPLSVKFTSDTNNNFILSKVYTT